jgi:hypothetical protein
MAAVPFLFHHAFIWEPSHAFTLGCKWVYLVHAYAKSLSAGVENKF